MITLAVDTTGQYGSIALAKGGQVLEEVALDEPHGFSGVIFAEIRGLLTRQKIALEEVELFAGASGPGAFTGVRIGLAAMKGLGETLGRPVVAISNLEALAAYGSRDLRAVVIDARRGEIYGALFGKDGAPVIPEQVVRFSHFLELLAGYEFEWVSATFETFEPLLVGTPFEATPLVTAPRALAGMIARMAAEKPLTDAAVIEANYVRRSDAELLWKHW